MGPSKRKGSIRRQVLDLNAREDSPSRPTWQTKYQNVLPGEEVHQNGGSQISISDPAQKNPLSGLLGNYNSDSDSEESAQKPNSSLDAKVEDFLKEIQSISVEPLNKSQTEANVIQCEMPYPPSVTAWQQCYDHNSGYPYYWNTETNEVTWEMPANLKAAVANVAMKQKYQQIQPQVKSNVKKKMCKYPWQTESDSEDEKIEMISSFGPQSNEESGGEEDIKNSKIDSVGDHLPLSATSSKLRTNCITLAPEDPAGFNESTYETSSLLTHGVQDTGPPGDESFQMHKQSTTKEIASNTKEESKIQISLDIPVETNPVQVDQTVSTEKQDILKESVEEDKVLSESLADDVIAQIEKETPPDYEEKMKSEKHKIQTPSVNQPTSGIALIANYGDDSESEDSSLSEKRKNNSKTSAKFVFPTEITQEKTKPLFPCMGVEPPKTVVEIRPKEVPQDGPELESTNNIYSAELDDPAAQKAFKRKKRIEFATIAYGLSTSKVSEGKTEAHELSVSVPSTQYNLDPNLNDHQGFGFNSLKAQTDSEGKTYKNCGGIQFIKAETMNLSEPKPKTETASENASAPKNSSKEPVRDEEIKDAASLLREKVMFLTGGTSSISPIEHMAIELETLVMAWQQGALTPTYLLRWLKEKCSELIHHEKTAAPTGWTCLWDRKSKRYFYRNVATKAIQWEYPNVEEKSKGKEDVEGAGDEMDICDTPPHSSPLGLEKGKDETPTTPPPPVISDVSDNVCPPSPTPQPPPPPQISFCPESESLSAKVVKKKKRKLEEISISTEDEENTATSSLASAKYEQGSENVETPPLPPMPPPPPPPPDESPPPLPDSPPPLPDSPPPLPLEPDQPLPPGVDEPEYSLYRTSKHSYKKAQPDSAAYPAELMMTYGYGLPVVSTNGQTMTMQMPSLEYHTYMHEPVTNPYLVQSMSTSHVIHCPAKKPKPSLTSELVSFYSDLAMLDNATENSSSNVENALAAAPIQEPISAPTSTPASAAAPVPVPVQPLASTMPSVPLKSSIDFSSTSAKAVENVTSNGMNIKKKKKTKTASGLSLKKKGVSSLVAKWQQVQQEVRRDFSDEDDDVSLAK